MSAHDGRRYEELEGALGILTRYLPISAQVNDLQRIADFLPGVDQGLTDAAQWHEYFDWEQTAPIGSGPLLPSYGVAFEFEIRPPGTRLRACRWRSTRRMRASSASS